MSNQHPLLVTVSHRASAQLTVQGLTGILLMQQVNAVGCMVRGLVQDMSTSRTAQCTMTLCTSAVATTIVLVTPATSTMVSTITLVVYKYYV